MKSLYIMIFAGLSLSSIIGKAQDDADKFFAKRNFDEAYNLYSRYETAGLSIQRQYNMAVAILNGSNPDKSEAVPLLEHYLAEKPEDGNAIYLYARSLLFCLRFDEAEKQFTRCLDIKDISEQNRRDAGHELEYCQRARVLVPYKISIKEENPGTVINSVFTDYYPFTDSSESVLYFNTRRNDGSLEKENGDYTANIYCALVKNGQYEKAFPLQGKINDAAIDEEIVGLSRDGKRAIICTESKNGNADLKIARLDRGKVVGWEKMPRGVNTQYHEIAATFGPGQNEIYFASDRPGGFGGIDLYVIRKGPDGKWAEPQNLGPEINTVFDEDFPNLSVDGKYLIFSSKGHSSMGGYDIFRAEWDPAVLRFVRPVNMGYPINTLFDDMNLNFSGSGRYGYLAHLTAKNNYDISRITFDEVDPELTVISGEIKVNRQPGELLSGVLMVVEDVMSGDIKGEYLPNPNTMHYVMALEPGAYKITITIDGYEPLEEKLVVKGKGSYIPELQKDYELKKN